MARSSHVLILVLVEHTLGEYAMLSYVGEEERLNPCFSGTYSRRTPRRSSSNRSSVLILVLVEHTLGAPEVSTSFFDQCLNPCFSGTYSRSDSQYGSSCCFFMVLILVLVEHTLGEFITIERWKDNES